MVLINNRDEEQIRFFLADEDLRGIQYVHGDFSEEDVHVQEREVSGFALATLKEIQAYAKEGIFLHYDSIRQVFEQ